MQIFFLETDINRNAHSYYDKHVGKILLEITQMVCGLFQEKGVVAPYKVPEKSLSGSQYKWLKSSSQNISYAINMGFALSEEFSKRYKNEHGATDVLNWAVENLEHIGIKVNLSVSTPKTPPFFIKDDKYIVNLEDLSASNAKELKNIFGENYLDFANSLLSYREYYYHKKGDLANWKHGKAPEWHKNHNKSCLIE